MESYIHIGMPKSASTYLQNVYFSQLDDVYYIQKTQNAFISERVNSIYIDFTKNYQSEVLEYCESNGINKLIYSQETITKMYKNKGKDVVFHLQILKKIFSNIKIIYIVRKQDDFILSAYKNSIMNGNNLSLKKFMNYNKIYNDVHHNKMLFLNWQEVNLYSRVKELHELFGEENVIVLPFELIKSNKELFFDKLNKFMDVDYEIKDDDAKTNVSFNDLQIKVLSFLNKFTNNGTNGLYFIVNNPLRSLFNLKVKFDRYLHINYLIKLFNFKFKSYKLMDKQLRDEINDYYDEDNRKLSELIKIDLSKFGYHTHRKSEKKI